MATATLEERVATLEAELAAIKRRRDLTDLPDVTGRTAPDFLDTFTGIYANDEMAERVFKRIADEREREREAARQAGDTDEL